MSQLRLLIGRRAFERELEDELRFHLEMEARRHEERGLGPEAARALAEREFGRVSTLSSPSRANEPAQAPQTVEQ